MPGLLSQTDFYHLHDARNPFLIDNTEKVNKTLADFVHDTARLYRHFAARRESVFLIFSDSVYEFMLILVAALLAKKKAALLNTNKYAYIKELVTEDTFFVSDTGESQCAVAQLLCGAFSEASTDTPATGAQSDTATQDCSILQGLSISPSADIWFYTSGSTGKPKIIKKKLFHLEGEIEQLLSFFSKDIENSLFVSSVFHYHLYGFSFYVLLPFAARCPIFKNRINYLETCAAFPSQKKITLISSPAFLKRIVKIPLPPSVQWTVFSSAGALDADAAVNCESIFNTKAIEIYGSTETGILATRKQKDNPLWRPFPAVCITTAADNSFTVCSPYFEGTVTGGDFIACTEDGSFTLLGRVDSTVKIEGRRVDLKDIDAKLLKLPDCADCHTIYHKTVSREQTVSFVVLKKGSPLYTLYKENEAEVKKHIREYLYRYFDKTIAPKKVYILESLPKNGMGKMNHVQLENIINRETAYRYTAGSIHFNDGHYTVDISLHFPADSVFFRGHFDDFPIVPAVAQVKTAFDISKKLFSHALYIQMAKKLKYTNMITPDIQLTLSLDFSPAEKRLSFLFFDADKKYSSGILHLEDVL